MTPNNSSPTLLSNISPGKGCGGGGDQVHKTPSAKVLGGVPPPEKILEDRGACCTEDENATPRGVPRSGMVLCNPTLDEARALRSKIDAAPDGPEGAAIVAQTSGRYCHVLPTLCTLVRQGERLLQSTAMGHSVVVVVALGRARCKIGGSRRDPPLLSQVLAWRDSAYRSDPTRSRLGQHRMGRPRTRWEDSLQETCNKHSAAFTPWQVLAQDKDAWAALEAEFIQRHVRTSREQAAVPRGRWMIFETPP